MKSMMGGALDWFVVGVIAVVSMGSAAGAAEGESVGNTNAPTATKKTAVLAIHLVTKAKDSNHSQFVAPQGLVEVDSEPVLADRDFVSFDFKEQEFVITGAAALRLSQASWGSKTPTILREGRYEFLPFRQLFVLKAEGAPIYVGVFTSLTSSFSFHGPCILADEPFLVQGKSKARKLRIEAGYPGGFGGKDLRQDARIAAAVKKLFPPIKD